MKLSELIAAVGDENVQFQNLQSCLTEIRKTKHGVKVTFATTGMTASEIATQDFKNLCLIVWLPKDKLPKEFQ